MFLDVPIQAIEFTLDSIDNTLYFHGNIARNIESKFARLPQGNYELIGLAKDVSEEVAKEILGQIYTEEEYSKSSIQLYRYELDKVVQSLGLNNPIILKKI